MSWLELTPEGEELLAGRDPVEACVVGGPAAAELAGVSLATWKRWVKAGSVVRVGSVHGGDLFLRPDKEQP